MFADLSDVNKGIVLTLADSAQNFATPNDELCR
jgi:hypothetical protein